MMDKEDLERIPKNQKQLKEISVSRFLAEHNLEYETLEFWANQDLLTELPSRDGDFKPEIYYQVNFLTTLYKSEVSWKKVMNLLSKLEKPYTYHSKGLLYDVNKDEFTTKSSIEREALQGEMLEEKLLDRAQDIEEIINRFEETLDLIYDTIEKD